MASPRTLEIQKERDAGRLRVRRGVGYFRMPDGMPMAINKEGGNERAPGFKRTNDGTGKLRLRSRRGKIKKIRVQVR